MGLAARDMSATEAALANAPALQGSGWVAKGQEAAAARVAEMGLPIARDEYWRFTKPDALLGHPPAPMAADAPHFDGVDSVTLTFRGGTFDAAASDDPAAAGVELDRLSEIAQTDIHWAQELYGTLETAAQTHVPRPLAALTTRMARDGLVIRATAAAKKPIRLQYLPGEDTAALHHVIRVEPGASITIIEEGQLSGRTTTNMEVDIADGGAFHHIRVQGPAPSRQTVTGLFARLGRESVFKSFTLALGGVVTRNEATIDFTGDDATAHIAGAAIGGGAYLHDDTVFITHDAVNCESRQVFKKVLREGAVGVFQGKILVQPDAQKTDGYQISQGLLLHDDAQFLAKPELEIYADDVACSHGSTCGSVDEEQLFYLTSRGIPRKAAEDMLVLSFLAEAIEEVEDEALAEHLTARLDALLAGHA